MRNIWIDYLRVLAIMSVVLGHTVVRYYNKYGSIALHEWWAVNILATFLHFSVPAFVMASGSVLLGRDYGIREFYVKRALRLIPAIIFWSLFYVAFDFYFYGVELSSVIWRLTAGLVISGSTYFHLWYLSMFVCLMLVAPFINSFILGKKPSWEEFIFLFFVIAFFLSLNQASLIGEEVFNVQMDWFKSFPWYVGYFIMGYMLRVYYDRIPVGNAVTIFFLITMIVLGSYMSYWSASNYGILKDYFISNDAGIVTFMVTMAVFHLFSRNRKIFKEHRLVSAVAAMSFGIYLIHPVFLRILQKYIPPSVQTSTAYILPAFITTFMASCATLYALRKIKWFRAVS